MPRSTGVRAAKAKETREALIGAARRLFGVKGFHATGTTEIVALAQVTRGALQHHFPHKEDLFLAVFEAVEQDMLAAAGGAGEGSWERLKENVGSFLRAAAHPEVQRVILVDGPAVLGWAEWRRLEAHYGLGIITAAVEEGIATGRIRPQLAKPLAHMILSVIDEAALMVAHAADPEEAREQARVALETLLSSLA